MATATSRSSQRPKPLAQPERSGSRSKLMNGLLRLFDMIFRFLASLKLAVICLGTLSATLAVGTWFNSRFGQNAVNEYIYQTKGFALLMAFLGINVLCAALIRYPWTKRQTGFLITHVGLLVVIGGSWWAAQTSDEGQLGMKEGDTSSRLIRNHKPVIYIKPIDPHTENSLGEYKVSVRPGAFDWNPGEYQVVSRPEDPFKLAIKGYYAGSILKDIVVPAASGKPMVKVRPTIIPPGQKVARDVFPDEEDRWFAISNENINRVVKDAGPAQFIVTRTNRPEVFEDFLNPPSDPGVEGVALLHYEDNSGKTRRFDVRLDDAKVGQPIALPGSDLTATFSKLSHLPIEGEQGRTLGTDSLDIVQFVVRKGDGPGVEHNGYAMLPSIPAIIPTRNAPSETPPAELLRVNYYGPPVIDPKVNRKFGMIEVMVDPSGKLAYRVFERGNPGKLRSHGPLKPGEKITAFGGNELAPMTLGFEVEQFLKAGRKEVIAESIEMPQGKRDDAIPSILAELTVKGITRDVWLRKSPDFEIAYKKVALGDSLYELAFDVDRMDLGFSLTLKDFDVGFDPGTSNASSYRSEVTLNDEKAGIKDAPKSIFMNHTLDHRGWRFFQTSYYPYTDKETGRPTGEFVSVFQVSKNPARELIYGGCIIVVLGAFVQFYMRAGVFSDGGKLQRERAEKARRRLEAKTSPGASATRPEVIPSKFTTPKPDDDFEPL